MSLSWGWYGSSPNGVETERGKMLHVHLNSGLGGPSLGIFLTDFWEQKTRRWVAGGHVAFVVCFNSSNLPLFLVFWKLSYRWIAVLAFLITGFEYLIYRTNAICKWRGVGLILGVSHDMGAALKSECMDAQIAAFKNKYSFSIWNKYSEGNELFQRFLAWLSTKSTNIFLARLVLKISPRCYGYLQLNLGLQFTTIFRSSSQFHL